jgi:hypothetical protein
MKADGVSVELPQVDCEGLRDCVSDPVWLTVPHEESDGETVCVPLADSQEERVGLMEDAVERVGVADVDAQPE